MGKQGFKAGNTHGSAGRGGNRSQPLTNDDALAPGVCVCAVCSVPYAVCCVLCRRVRAYPHALRHCVYVRARVCVCVRARVCVRATHATCVQRTQRSCNARTVARTLPYPCAPYKPAFPRR